MFLQPEITGQFAPTLERRCQHVQKNTHWLQTGVQAAVIIGSILMAFGIEAWWDDQQEAAHRTALLEDLQAEVVFNQEALESTLDRQRLRAQRIELILGEI